MASSKRKPLVARAFDLDLPMGLKFAAVCMADWSLDGMTCHASLAALARRMGISESQARRYRNDLIDRRVIEPQGDTENGRLVGGNRALAPVFRLLFAEPTPSTDGRGGGLGIRDGSTPSMDGRGQGRVTPTIGASDPCHSGHSPLPNSGLTPPVGGTPTVSTVFPTERTTGGRSRADDLSIEQEGAENQSKEAQSRVEQERFDRVQSMLRAYGVAVSGSADIGLASLLRQGKHTDEMIEAAAFNLRRKALEFCRSGESPHIRVTAVVDRVLWARDGDVLALRAHRIAELLQGCGVDCSGEEPILMTLARDPGGFPDGLLLEARSRARSASLAEVALAAHGLRDQHAAVRSAPTVRCDEAPPF